jgi:hypothetical protein
MNNGTTKSGKQQTSVRNVFVLKTNVFHSGIRGYACAQLAYRTAYDTGIHLALADRKGYVLSLIIL